MAEKKGILVIEDEQPLLVAIKAKLTKSGFSVITARSAEVGWNMLNDGVGIDVIWLDHYLLGQATGLDFLAKVKEGDRFRDLPVFVVSNTASPDKQQAYLKLGVQKYFTKSMARLDDIVADIKKSLKNDE